MVWTTPKTWAASDDITAALLNEQLRDNLNFLHGSVSSSPTGSVMIFAGINAPAEWLVCDGSAVSRTTYANLFTALGTTYGEGDGAATFNLPDMRGRAPIGAGTGVGLTQRILGAEAGAETVTLSVSNLPPHNHTIRFWEHNSGGNSTNRWPVSDGWASGYRRNVSETDVVLNTGSGTPVHGTLPHITMNFIIKT